jgi:phosphatidylglycerol:prolipoprotein diacylglycerol transferase
VTGAFPLVFALGSLASLLWLALSGPAAGIVARVDAGLSALAGGLIGARAGFVLVHLAYYAARPAEILQFWQGGLSAIGGAVGAVIGLGLYCLATRQAFWPLADALAIPVTIMGLASWSGCLLDGCAYGRRASLGWLTPPAPDMFGTYAARLPTQAAGALYSLAVLAFLQRLHGQRRLPGWDVCLSVALVFAGSLALAFTRGDPSPSLAGLRLDGLGAGVSLALALAALGTRVWSNRSLRKPYAASDAGTGSDQHPSG